MQQGDKIVVKVPPGSNQKKGKSKALVSELMNTEGLKD